MKILKVVSIVLGSVVLILGAIFLGLFLTGKFNEPVYWAEDIFFAEKVVDEEGVTTYVEKQTNYEASGNFELVISTKTEIVTKTAVNLFFNTKNDVVKYLSPSETKANYAAFVDGSVKYFTENKDGEYVTNGKIIVPKTVYLNTYFTAYACVAPDDLNDKTSVEYFNVGGATTLYAQSENKEISSKHANILIDVPVSKIEVVATTSNGGEEIDLTFENNAYKVDLETFFGARVKFVPARSQYKFGNVNDKKQIVFGINFDETNICFVDASDNKLNVSAATLGKLFSKSTGDAKIFARVFKDALMENQNAVTNVEALFEALNNEAVGVSNSANIKIAPISIQGFEIDNNLKDTQIDFSINKAQLITANGSSNKNLNLGINILAKDYVEGTAQKEVQNMYISLQALVGEDWVDATSDLLKLFAVLDADKIVVSGENVYTGNFYKIKFLPSAMNESYWKVVALNENINEYPIRIVVAYKVDDELKIDNSKFGYELNAYIESTSTSEAVVDWNETDNLKTSDQLIANTKNDKILFINNGVATPIIIDLSRISVISNLDQNPTYTLVKYFIYSTDADLEDKINCKKYDFKISGVPENIDGKTVYIYEITSNEKLVVSSIGEKAEFDFNLFFAVVKHDYFDSPSLNDDGSYKVVSISKNSSGLLSYIPVLVSKTVEIKNISAEILDTTINQINYALQRTEDNLRLTIVINTSDFENFKRQVEKSNIKIYAVCGGLKFDGVYYKNGTSKISLENALAFAVLDKSAIANDGETTTIKLVLSTDAILFASNETEKQIEFKISYTIDSENIPTSVENPVVKTSNPINIYSGKISDFGIKDEQEKVLTSESEITIKKVIENGKISTKYYSNNNEFTLLNENGNLNIYFTGYGIDDSMILLSSDPTVLQITSKSEDGKIVYSISPLKSGKSTLTLKPNYSADENAKFVLKFVVESNFVLDDNDEDDRNKYVTDNSGTESSAGNGVISYDKNKGYTFIGAPVSDGNEIVDSNGRTYNFADLVKLYIKGNADETSTDVTNYLTFVLSSENSDLFGEGKYVELVTGDNGKITGFKILKKLGMPASFTIYYYSTELGYNYGVLQINLLPYYQISTSVDSNAPAAEGKEADSKFVYAESDVEFKNFTILGYDLLSKTYSNTNVFGGNLSYNERYFDNNKLNLTNEAQNTIATIKSNDNKNISSIKFVDVGKETRFELTVSDDGGTYGLSKTFVFYVYPNIQLAESNKFTEKDGVYYLNTQDTPNKNGESISWGESGTIVFERIKTGSGLDTEKFSYKVYEVGAKNDDEFTNGISYTISGVTKLSLYELVVSYAGKEFKFRFYVEPNITESGTTITFDGEKYYIFYAGEDVSTSNIQFCGLINDSKNIKSLAALAKLGIISDKYKLFDGSNLTITKNEYDLFETYIVFASGDKYIVRKALIFPQEWKTGEGYIKYKDIVFNNLDLKDILDGKVNQEGKEKQYIEIDSGNVIAGFETILSSNKFIYKIYNITNNTLLYNSSLSDTQHKNTDFVELRNGSGNWQIVTKYAGKTYSYRIDFTISFEDSTMQDSNIFSYTFSYYFTAKATQKIQINYPFTDSNPNEALMNFDNAHKVYYSEFENDKYSIDLLSNKFNMKGTNYVELKNGNASQQLKFEILYLSANGLEISNDRYETFAELSDKGVLTLKSNTHESVDMIIKISTNTDALAYYKLVITNSKPNYAFGKSSTEIFDKTELSGKDFTDGEFDLSGFGLFQKSGDSYTSIDKVLHFVLLSTDGVLQTKDNAKLYVDENKKLVALAAPKTLEGYLYAYTEDGIVSRIKVTIASPITVGQNKTSLSGDSSTSLSGCLTVKVDGETGSSSFTSEFEFDIDAMGKGYKLEDGVLYFNKEKIATISDGTITIYPTATKGLTVKVTYKIYDNGSVLEGTSKDDPCTGTLKFDITPNIELKDDVKEITANNSGTTLTIGTEVESFGGLFKLKNGTSSDYTLTIKSITSTLSSEELKIWGDLNDKITLSNPATLASNTLTIATSAVATDRYIYVEFELTNDGKTFTSTLTIKVVKDTTVEITYPNFGTEQTMEHHLIGWDDWGTTNKITILDDINVKIKSTSSGHTVELRLDGNNQLIELDGTTGIKLTGSAPTYATDIVLKIYVDGIFRENYIVRIVPGSVFSAKFTDGNLNTLNKTFTIGNGTLDEKYFNNQNITFYFNGKEIPYDTAKTLFKIDKCTETNEHDCLDSFTLSMCYGKSPAVHNPYEIKFVRKDGTQNEFATYSFTLVYDYKFNGDVYDNVKSGSLSGKANETYNSGEFSGYGLGENATAKVFKTIELTAGENYSLLDLLKENFKLKNYAGGDYTSGLLYLGYGKYNTNANYNSNMASLINLQAITTGDITTNYTIMPNGAKNGGDIVHLVLVMGQGSIPQKSDNDNADDYTNEEVYILRIKILPKVEIKPVNSSRIVNIAYGSDGNLLTDTGLTINGTEQTDLYSVQVYSIPLTSLISYSGIDAKDLIVSVGKGSEYVVGSGLSNRLGVLPNNGGYGIQLRKTIFGGNEIELTISDRFGYSVKISIVYSNADKTSPTIMSAPNSIYEGESFTLAFYIGNTSGENKYVVYGAKTPSAAYSWDIADGDEKLSLYSNVIIVDNFDKKVLNDLLHLNESGEIKSATPTFSKFGLISSASFFDGLGENEHGTKVKFVSNSVFNGGISISGGAAGVKLVLEVANAALGTGFMERVELEIPTTFNQRYQIQLKDPYSRESTLYFGVGRTYYFSDLFQLYDLKNGRVVSGEKLLTYTNLAPTQTGINNDISLTPNGSSTSYTGFTPQFANGMFSSGKTQDKGKRTFTITVGTVNGDNVGTSHTLTYNVCFTPKYYSIKNPNDYHDTYGKIVDGNVSSTTADFETWAAGFTMLDYYGNAIDSSTMKNLSADLNFEKISGTGSLSASDANPSYQLTDLSADHAVKIKVMCNGATIGEVLVTMRRYYALSGSGTITGDIINTNILNFAQWAADIKALVAGGTTSEDIPSGLSNFTFQALTKGYDIRLENDEYKLKKYSGNFASGDSVLVGVSYLGKFIGFVGINIANDNTSTYAASELILKSNNATVELTDTGLTALDFSVWAKNIFVDAVNVTGFSFSATGYTFDGNFKLTKDSGSIQDGEKIEITVKYLDVEVGKCTLTCKYKFQSVENSETTLVVDSTMYEGIPQNEWAQYVIMVDCFSQKISLADCLADANIKVELKTEKYYLNSENEIVINGYYNTINEQIELEVFYLGKSLGTASINVKPKYISMVDLELEKEIIKEDTSISSINFSDYGDHIWLVAYNNDVYTLSDCINEFKDEIALISTGYDFDENFNIIKTDSENFADGDIVYLGIDFLGYALGIVKFEVKKVNDKLQVLMSDFTNADLQCWETNPQNLSDVILSKRTNESIYLNELLTDILVSTQISEQIKLTDIQDCIEYKSVTSGVALGEDGNTITPTGGRYVENVPFSFEVYFGSLKLGSLTFVITDIQRNTTVYSITISRSMSA